MTVRHDPYRFPILRVSRRRRDRTTAIPDPVHPVREIRREVLDKILAEIVETGPDRARRRYAA